MRLAAAALAIATLLLATVACTGPSDDRKTLSIRYSLFSDEVVEARAGKPVTFELRNDDPILHEWIVGTADVHERHRSGMEPYHDEVPTEVSLPPYETRITTVVFDEPGEYLFVCHLPGHEAYGMKGVIRVR